MQAKTATKASVLRPMAYMKAPYRQKKVLTSVSQSQTVIVRVFVLVSGGVPLSRIKIGK